MPRQAQLVVSLSAASTAVVTVNYATANGTAVAPSDYTAQTGTLTFAPGETSKTISVTVRDDLEGSLAEAFSVVLSSPTNATILDGTGLVTLGAGGLPEYYMRFNWVYDKLHDNAIGYFGPQTGANAFAVPRHIPEVDPRIINEAPDYGGQSVSETASFWVALEAYKGLISSDWTGYTNAWNKINQFYVPSAVNQPIGTYNAAKPADFIPEQDLPTNYPPATNVTAPVGSDPLYSELMATYGTPNVYLMHWLIDVEGAYGFRNGSGETKITFMNTFQRGKQESSYETVPHAAWNDWANGGGTNGCEPLFTSNNLFPYSRKWSYTNAPDAEVRAIQWAFWAKKFATEQGVAATIQTSTDRARKMGDYTRYNLLDKYFREIGNNANAGVSFTDPTDGNTYHNAYHYLINWYASWGGDLVTTGIGAWSYRIGCSESHQGYQSVMAAYAMATGGGGMTPQSPSAGRIWSRSLLRQIEMIRWLQSPQGPIAGGVTNSLNGRYDAPSGRAAAGTFYGQHYVYSPVWADPPSNNWVGFQCWGQGRTADLFLETSTATNQLALDVMPNLEIILDRLVGWFIRNSTMAATTFSIPAKLNWVETAANANGSTTMSTSVPEYDINLNLRPVFPRVPTLNWDYTGNYANFWNAATVPNPTLTCNIDTTEVSLHPDLGVASGWAYLLITYAKAKQNLNKFTTDVTLTYGSDGEHTHTAQQAFTLAKDMLDRIWDNYRDTVGITTEETRGDYKRMANGVYVPSGFTGAMPNGDAINGSSTFITIRSFLTTDPKWTDVQAYVNDPIDLKKPKFTYHRFWAQVEFAVANAALQKHFANIL